MSPVFFLSLEGFLDSASEETNLVYSRFSSAKAGLCFRELGIYYGVNPLQNEPFEKLEWCAKKGYGSVTLGVIEGLFRFGDCDYQCLSPNFWDFHFVFTPIPMFPEYQRDRRGRNFTVASRRLL